jgi:hypothetical protein
VLLPSAWTPSAVREGATGPWVVESIPCAVVARTPPRQTGHPERAVGVRSRERAQQEGVYVDCALTLAPFKLLHTADRAGGASLATVLRMSAVVYLSMSEAIIIEMY